MRILLVGVFDSSYAMSGELRARSLRELGHEVTTVDYRAAGPRALRRALRTFDRRRALSTVLTALAERMVDLVVVLKGECFDAEAVAIIRRMARAPVVNWFPDDPHQCHLSRVIAPAYDLFFTHDNYTVEQLMRTGVRHARYLPFGCHPAVHRRYEHGSGLQGIAPAGSILFIGTYDPVRAGVLSAIADLGLTVAGPGWQSSHLRGATVVEEGIYGERMFQAFSLARICVNIHQNFGGPIATYGTGLNSRVFEVTGCGGLLLTDRKRDLHELFTEDGEVACYSSREELRERVEHLLKDVPRARAVAEAGRIRAIGSHTLHHRFRSMIAEVGRLGSAA